MANPGEINRGNVLRSKVLDRNFRTAGSGYRNENGGLECGEKTCDAVAPRQLLRLH